MSFKFLKVSFVWLILSLTSIANASLITIGGSEVNTPDFIFGFEMESLSNGNWEPLTNQFSSNGLTVVNNSGYANLSAGYCMPSKFNETGTGYLMIGVSHGCTVSDTIDDVTFIFSSFVNAMSFDLYTHSTTHQFEIFLYDNTTQVGYQQFNGTKGATEVFSATGAVFNSFQIREFGSSREWLWLDQLAVKFEPSQKVPEPSTLAILALGMIGLASRRNKKPVL
ncbi:PEP-CTERM sorting domain-containing protein [Thalassotalea fusca]